MERISGTEENCGMRSPAKIEYLYELCDVLAMRWPNNRTVNIVCHGHSVPAGYACTPWVDSFHAYPHAVHTRLKQMFPYAVINVIVTAIGGENSAEGEKRFMKDVLAHSPSLITIDYGLNDRGLGLPAAEKAWRSMIEMALRQKVRVLLMTPSWDTSWFEKNESWRELEKHACQIRRLSEEYRIGLGDSFQAFERYIHSGGDLQDLLSHVNHPSPLGHQLIAREITSWFIPR